MSAQNSDNDISEQCSPQSLMPELPARQKPAEEYCRPSVVPRLIESNDPAFVYAPKLKKLNPHTLQVLAKREDPGLVPWGFWGGVLLGTLAVYLVFFRGSMGIGSNLEMGLFLAALVAGVVLFRLGRRSSLREGLLLEVDGSRRLLAWPTAARGSSIDLSFEEVEAVVYGLTNFKVRKEEGAGSVHAFTLRVRDNRGQLIPVIEASPEKEGLHELAKVLSQVLGKPLEYAGLGIDE